MSEKHPKPLPVEATLPEPACEPGMFPIAAIGLDHSHIYGQCQALKKAGATVKWVYDPDPAKVKAFSEKFPEAQVAKAEDEILDDPEVRMVTAAAIPSDRCDLGLRVMEAGKDYFSDKPAMTTLEQLAAAREVTARTGRKYMVYFGERLGNEAAWYAGELILRQRAIGRVVEIIGTGPHRATPPSRPDWFFDPDRYGGILCDIGSHQVEQFLYFTEATDARVLNSAVGNFHFKQYPGLQDYGYMTLETDNQATAHLRVDWYTPDGLRTWGDGRTFVLGTEGYIEMRKYIDVGRESSGNHLFLVNGEGEFHASLTGKIGAPFFPALIRDCLERTEEAMTQAHAFKATEIALQAQKAARRLS